jgi:hypothetical protein
VLGTEDVACVDAKHLCVNSRGIRDMNSNTITGEFGGKFKIWRLNASFWITLKFGHTVLNLFQISILECLVVGIPLS